MYTTYNILRVTVHNHFINMCIQDLIKYNSVDLLHNEY